MLSAVRQPLRNGLRRSQWTMAQVVAKANEVHAVPYVPANEPEVVIPHYDGLTPELGALLKSPQPAGYTPAALRHERPGMDTVAKSVLEYVGNTPMIHCSP